MCCISRDGYGIINRTRGEFVLMKYFNQTTVNVIALATAVVAGLSLVGVGQGPDRAMKKQMLHITFDNQSS